MTYTYEPTFNVSLYAKARVDGATAFRSSVTQKYRDNYSDFWCLGRPEVSAENMQAILDELGPLVFQILTDSSTFVAAITTAFPDELEEKYESAPYDYTIIEGRLVLGDLKEAWQPETPEEEVPPSE
jgi:hypothetical protein